MWEMDYKKSWALKNWCFWTVVLEKTLESPLDCKEIWPVHPTGNQSWIFIGRAVPEAEAPIFWPPDEWLYWTANSVEKTLMLGKIEGKKRRGQHKKRWLDSMTDSMDMNLSKLEETVEDRVAWSAAVHGVTKSQTRLCDWTTTIERWKGTSQAEVQSCKAGKTYKEEEQLKDSKLRMAQNKTRTFGQS